MQEKIQSVKEKITLMRSGPSKKRFSSSLKNEILSLYSASEHPIKLLRELQVNYGTVVKWRKTSKPKEKRSDSTFRPVSILTNTAEAPRLILADDVCIENLSEELVF